MRVTLMIAIVFGHLAVGAAYVVLALLSRRLGEAWGMPRYYLLIYAALTLIGSSLLYHFAIFHKAGLPENGPQVFLPAQVVYAVGATIITVVVWRYWGWLVKELLAGGSR